MIDDFVHGFDLDIALADAACDPAVSPERRAIANLCIGMDGDDAYYSMRELREAMLLVFEGDEFFHAPGFEARAILLVGLQIDAVAIGQREHLPVEIISRAAEHFAHGYLAEQ